MHSDRSRAEALIDQAEPEFLPTLERWVAINSFTENIDGVNRMASQLEADMALAGWSVARHKGDGVGDHLVWTTEAWRSQPTRRIVLIGHHDTVFPPGTFETWQLDGDRLCGPGVLDMKGGLIVIRAALAALESMDKLSGLPLGLITVGDEETGSARSQSLIAREASGALAALVFESGRADDSIVTARKGTGGVFVDAEGVAAHAGNQHADGRNAIWALAQLIDRVQGLTDYERGVTVNVGTISGGEAKNSVPARARCGIDVRAVRPADGDALIAAIGDIAAEVADDSGVKLTVSGGFSRKPLVPTEASTELFRRYAAHAARVGLGSAECPLVGGGSDANTVSAIGVPVIDALGPRGRGFHTHNEHIFVHTLALRAKALVGLLLEMAAD